MQTSHYFIALPIEENVKRQMKEWTRGLPENISFKQWVYEQDYHITLVFLGAVPGHILASLLLRLEDIAKNAPSFPLELTGIQTFGKREMPRIFYRAVKPCDSLTNLQKQIADVCIELGFSVDQRPYTPHITIAKKWMGKVPYQQERVKQKEDELRLSKVMASSFVLYRIHPSQKPKYEIVRSYPLQTNG